MTAKTLARKVARFALTKKASDVVIADLRKISSVADYFVICSAGSDVQVRAVADAVVTGMKKIGLDAWHEEGYSHLNWVLLDYVDVVVHIFQKEIRSYYNLERLWGDAKFEPVQDEAPKVSSSRTKNLKKRGS